MGVELARLVGIDLLPPEACEALAWRPGGPHSHMGGGREGRRREEEKEKEEKEEEKEKEEKEEEEAAKGEVRRSKEEHCTPHTFLSSTRHCVQLALFALPAFGCTPQ